MNNPTQQQPRETWVAPSVDDPRPVEDWGIDEVIAFVEQFGADAAASFFAEEMFA